MSLMVPVEIHTGPDTSHPTKHAYFEIVDVTPEMAAEWLDNMAPNRKASQKRVSALAVQMQTGLWVFDASPIRFDTQGRLVDGQNRLHAVIESGMTIPFAIARGIAPQAMAVMDTGKTRTLSDMMQMAYPDLTQVNSVAALTRLLYIWEKGMRGTPLRSYASRGTIPNQVLLDYFDEHEEEIRHAVTQARNYMQRYPGITGGALALCYTLFHRIDADDTDYFFERFADGAGLEAGSPILALRKRAKDAAMEDRRAALPADEGIAIVIKAWNAFREGRPVHILSWKRGGSSPEAFPEPV